MWSARTAFANFLGLTPRQLDDILLERTGAPHDLTTLYEDGLARFRRYEVCATCHVLFVPSTAQRWHVRQSHWVYCPEHHQR